MDLLFSKNDSFSLSQHVMQQARLAADSISEATLKIKTDDEVVLELVEDHRLLVCEILWDQSNVSREEAMVDLRFVPNTMASYGQRSVMKPGEKYTISVPYRGIGDFFL